MVTDSDVVGLLRTFYDRALTIMPELQDLAIEEGDGSDGNEKCREALASSGVG